VIASNLSRKIYKDFPGGFVPDDSDPGFLEEFTLTFDIEMYDCE
jgi:hypothetical protein